MSTNDDDLIPETAEGYTVTEKKTIDEYNKLDAEDESLAKWKALLGLGPDSKPYPVKAGDSRKVVVVELSVEFPENPELKTIVINLEDADGTTIANNKINFSIKERSVYQFGVKFRVQHELITGLKYLHSIKKSGIRVEKVEEPLGSFAPSTLDKPTYSKKFAEVEAPGGMLARGNYSATAKFVDDDKTVHLTFPWSFSITK